MDELYEVFRPPVQIAVYANNGEAACLVDDASSVCSYGSTSSSLISLTLTHPRLLPSVPSCAASMAMSSSRSCDSNVISPMYIDEATSVTSPPTTIDGSDNDSLDGAVVACNGVCSLSIRDVGSVGNAASERVSSDVASSCSSPILPVEGCLMGSPSESHGKLGTVALAVMVFYSVSGGPFGVESSVRSGGNFYTLLGFIVMPFVWSVQEAFMTAELGSAFPEASGGVAWVEEAFGQRAGFMAGYLGWIAGATDNAIYPVLFLDYLLQVVQSDGDEISPMFRFALLSCTSIVLGFVNWLGLPIVGRMSMFICLVAMSPFFVLTVVGMFKVQPHRWFQMPDAGNIDAILDVEDDDGIAGGFIPNAALGGILWRPFLNNMFWNLNSFDAAGSFAADIDGEAGRVFPRAMGLSVLMVSLGYLIPLLVTLGASDAKQTDWVDGYLARACSDIVGPWLGGWTVFAAGISNIALFQAELSADAFQLMGMADRGHLPKIFSQRSRHGTPTYGVLLGVTIIVVMGVSHLDRLIEMLNFNYAVSLLMEYLSFVKLRISRPDMERPYRIPMNTTCCVLALTPTFVAILAILCLANYSTYMFCVASNLVGILIYLASRPGSCGIFASWFQCRKKTKAYYLQVETSLGTVSSIAAEAAAAAAAGVAPPSVAEDNNDVDNDADAKESYGVMA